MLHQYKNNGYNIVLDVNSGSVHVVDELMYDAMELGEKLIGEIDAPIKLSDQIKADIRTGLKDKYSVEEIEEAISDIQELIDAEELYTKDTYELYINDFKERQTVVKHSAYILLMTVIWLVNIALPKRENIMAEGH